MDLVADHSLPFAIGLGVMLLLSLIQFIGAGAICSVDGDADLRAEAAFDGSTSLMGGITTLLGIGRGPFLVCLMVFLFLFAAIGLGIQELAGNLTGGPLHGWLAALFFARATLPAAASGISASAVRRIWKSHGLQPHRYRQFKLSTDPKFADKLHDVVGLHVDPPAHAIVLSFDEKCQLQALDRTQPGLPLKTGRLGTMTHDYKRNGTTTLFAALDILDGTVIGSNMQQHRHQEFIRFLNTINASVPAGKAVHVILDNYAAHKHARVRAWPDRHPRFTFQFKPTSCSWLNAVEGLPAELTRRRLKRGVFHSVVDLQSAINRFVAEHDDKAKPITWTADPDKFIAAVR